MRFDFFKISVLGDFSAAKAYLDIMERAIPEAERREAEALKERGESDGWEFEDYECARQEQQSIFEYSVPQVLSYSFLTYVHGLVEVRLGDVARTLRKDRGLRMKHTHCAGSPIEKALIYLTMVADIRVASDLGWESLRNLATLRHAVVHRGGKLGADPRERKRLREIARQLPPGLTASDNWDDVVLTSSQLRALPSFRRGGAPLLRTAARANAPCLRRRNLSGCEPRPLGLSGRGSYDRPKALSISLGLQRRPILPRMLAPGRLAAEGSIDYPAPPVGR